MDAEIKLLEAKQRESSGSAPIDRDNLIKELRADAERLDGNFKQRQSVIKEYVNKIIITDGAVELQLIGDYDITGGATQI